MLPIHPKGLRNVQISLVNLHVSYSVSSLNFSRVTVIIYFLAMQNMYGMQTKNIKTYMLIQSENTFLKMEVPITSNVTSTNM